MNESEDLRTIDDFIKKQKIEKQDPDEFEYSEYIDYENSNNPEELIEIDDYEVPDYQTLDIPGTHSVSHLFTESEKKVIDLCEDPELKELVLLNRQKNIRLMQFYKKIKDLLLECQDNILIKEKYMKAEEKQKRVCNRIWRLGTPYFKSKDDYPCPRNEDTIRKHENSELFYYDMTPTNKWSEKDMNRLLKGISFLYKVAKKDELQKDIDKIEKEGNSVNNLKLHELKNKLEDLKNPDIDVYPPLGHETGINLNRIAENFLKDKFSAQDCEVFWNTYLHPSINKEKWTQEENEKIKELAIKYNFQNWDKIASELGNNRTGFITCTQYFYKIDPPRHGRFSPEEDKLLCELVQLYKQGNYVPWTKITHHFQQRTRAQLFYRYKYFLNDKKGKATGKFTMAEDILILILVDRFGKKYAKCSQYFPNRSNLQIKSRYTSNLRSAIKKGSFTIEEDRQILNHVKQHGVSAWESLVVKFNRCGAQIRQRYKTLSTFFHANPTATLEEAPRRRFTGIGFETEFDFLRCMADKFKDNETIPTLQDIENLLTINPKPNANSLIPLKPHQKRNLSKKRECKIKPNNEIEAKSNFVNIQAPFNLETKEKTGSLLVIDELLTDFFCNSMKLDFENNINPGQVYEASKAVTSALSALQVELHIPKNFNMDPRLDILDRQILNILVSEMPESNNNEYVINQKNLNIDRLIPPTLNTAVGIRSLLIKNHIYKSNVRKSHIFVEFREQESQKQILWCINNYLLSRSETVRNQLTSERNLFFKRFILLFKFPSIMTLQMPSQKLMTTSKIYAEGLTEMVRTYGKKPKSVEMQIGSNAIKNYINPPFESVFIKEQNMEEKFNNSSQPDNSKVLSMETQLTCEDSVDLFSVNPGFLQLQFDDHSHSFINETNQLEKEVDNAIHLNSKKNISDQLKKKITDILADLSLPRPEKRFNHPTNNSPLLVDSSKETNSCQNKTKECEDVKNITPPSSQSSMAAQLKKRITNTISELIRSPPVKRGYFDNTPTNSSKKRSTVVNIKKELQPKTSIQNQKQFILSGKKCVKVRLVTRQKIGGNMKTNSCASKSLTSSLNLNKYSLSEKPHDNVIQ